MINLKKTASNLFLAFLFTTSIQANAETHLNIDDGITLLAVNGKVIDHGNLFSGTGSINLKDGVNQILVNYTAEVKQGNESELETTQPDVILFKANDTKITLSAPAIKTMRDFNSFKNKNNWLLTDNSNKKIPFTSSTLKKDGFQLSRDYERELEELNSNSGPTALPKQIIVSHQEVISKNNNTTKTRKNMAIDMLVYWYNLADEKTRNSFKELIKSK